MGIKYPSAPQDCRPATEFKGNLRFSPLWVSSEHVIMTLNMFPPSSSGDLGGLTAQHLTDLIRRIAAASVAAAAAATAAVKSTATVAVTVVMNELNQSINKIYIEGAVIQSPSENRIPNRTVSQRRHLSFESRWSPICIAKQVYLELAMEAGSCCCASQWQWKTVRYGWHRDSESPWGNLCFRP